METEKLKNYAARIFTAAENNGFQPECVSIYHHLALIMAEVGEMIDADRNGRNARYDDFNLTLFGIDWGKDGAFDTWKAAFRRTIKDTVEDEMADVTIMLLELAQRIHLDFDRPFNTYYKRSFGEFDFCENAYALMKGIANPGILLPMRIRWSIDYIEKWYNSLHQDGAPALTWYIDRKLEYNATRGKRNGKRY